MAEVTALHARPRGRVAVELDDRPWRVLPTEVVVRCGLVVGGELDRAALRFLRRELRRSEALLASVRALRHRDLSASALTRRLEGRGVAPAARREAVDVLGRAGLLDDERLACSRADTLAGRGYGDAAVRADLERRGISEELAREAVAALLPELERARILLQRRTGGVRLLARRGFSEETIEALSGTIARDP